MLGAAPVAIQMAAGHQSFATTRQYVHVAAEALRETIKKLDDRLATAEGPTEGQMGPSRGPETENPFELK